MMDRQAASVLLIAAGIGLAVWYYTLDRAQRNGLLAGISGKTPEAAPKPTGGSSGTTAPPAGRSGGGPPVLPSAGVDSSGGLKGRWNRLRDRVEQQFRDLGIKPPFDIKPLP